MDASKWRARTIPDLIIEVWEALDCESVGRLELEAIQQTLHQRFGEGAVKSPAAIARTLADEGAVLRHPEVFECDSEWRERNLSGRDLATQLNFSSLSDAVASFGQLEAKRYAIANGAKDLERLRAIVTNARQESLLAARSKVLSAQQREEAREISEWLAVWLRSPELFGDWLDLRMRSADFKRKFGST